MEDKGPEPTKEELQDQFVESMRVPSKGHSDENGNLIPGNEEKEVANKVMGVATRFSSFQRGGNNYVDIDTAKRALQTLADTYPEQRGSIKQLLSNAQKLSEALGPDYDVE